MGDMAVNRFLIVLLVVNLGGDAYAVDCDCPTCDSCAEPCADAVDWICVPRCTTKSIEVTEWGVQTEVICPPRCQSCAFGLCGVDVMRRATTIATLPVPDFLDSILGSVRS